MTTEQLETDILFEVVTRFVDHREGTPKRSLLIKFEGQPAWHAIGNLLTSNSLRRKTMSNTSTEDEAYLPAAAAFQFCGSQRLRDEAKAATTLVLQTLKTMYKEESKKDGFVLEDLKRHVEAKYPTRMYDRATLELGLYLAKDFGVLGGYRLNPPDDTQVTWFQIGDSVISIPDPEKEWDRVMKGYKPRVDTSGFAVDNFQNDLGSLPGKESLLRDLTTLVHSRQLVSVVFIDLDNFKQVNDRHGHSEGDNCLEKIVGLISAAVLRKGKLYRVGSGDEFCVLLPNFSATEAAATAERVRGSVDALEPFNGTTKVTTSIGVATSDSDGERFVDAPEELIKAADEAMYIAKLTTKNRVTVWPPSESDRQLASKERERAKTR